MADEGQQPVGLEHRQKVDPAALLVGVFAVGAGPLLQSGRWDYVNTVTALVVLAVVLFFTWSSKAVRGAPTMTPAACFTYALVYGFMAGIAASYPMQQLIEWVHPHGSCVIPETASTVLEYLKSSGCINDRDTNIAYRGSAGGMAVGLLALIVFWRRLSNLSHTSIENGDETSSKPDASRPPANVDTADSSTAPKSEPGLNLRTSPPL